MQVIRPYLRVITHGGQWEGRNQSGTRSLHCFYSTWPEALFTINWNFLPSGYYGEGLNAIIVFSACYLPDSSCPDYHYIMENLFLWVCQGWLLVFKFTVHGWITECVGKSQDSKKVKIMHVLIIIRFFLVLFMFLCPCFIIYPWWCSIQRFWGNPVFPITKQQSLRAFPLLQVCGEQSGDACGWRLPDHLYERSHSSE